VRYNGSEGTQIIYIYGEPETTESVKEMVMGLTTGIRHPAGVGTIFMPSLHTESAILILYKHTLTLNLPPLQ
jgi:hypothetical protein